MAENATPKAGSANDRELPATIPVVTFAGRLVAVYEREFKGRNYVTLSEVKPARMDGTNVLAWAEVYQGLRLSWRSKLDAAKELDLARRAVGASA